MKMTALAPLYTLTMPASRTAKERPPRAVQRRWGWERDAVERGRGRGAELERGGGAGREYGAPGGGGRGGVVESSTEKWWEEAVLFWGARYIVTSRTPR